MSQRSYCAGFFTSFYALALTSGGRGTTFLPIGNNRDGWRFKRTKHVRKVPDDSAGEATIDVIGAGTDIELHGTTVMAALVRQSGLMFDQEIGLPPMSAPSAAQPITGEGNFNNSVGLLGSLTFGSLALTPVQVTQNALAWIGGGKSILFKYAAAINDMEMLLSSNLNEMPVTFQVLPDPATGLLYTIVDTSSLSGVTAIPAV